MSLFQKFNKKVAEFEENYYIPEELYQPENLLDFMKTYQPLVGNIEREYVLFPFWDLPLRDNHNHQVLLVARQGFKTSVLASILAMASLSRSESCYCVDSEVHRSAFSEQRLRQDCFLSNSKLASLLPFGKANIGRLKLRNRSTIYTTLDQYGFKQVEGKSLSCLCIDEAQYVELESLSRALYTLSQTKGKLIIAGIGGEAGSSWHKEWLKSDQREWHYDNDNWRDALIFDEHGDIINSDTELKDILAGKWNITQPQNSEHSHGWKINQTMFANIPLTIKDATAKYHTLPELSIEYQKRYNGSSVYLSHTMADFFRSNRRPITLELVQSCFLPEMSLLTQEQVLKLKSENADMRIYFGIDFGSGKTGASATVVSILLHFKKVGRYILAYIEKRPNEPVADQCFYLANLLHSYTVDYGLADYGYGQSSVENLQNGGTNSAGEKYTGLGRNTLEGSTTISDPTKPMMEHRQETDSKGTALGKVTLDKTRIIQDFVDLLEARLPQNAQSIPKFGIPSTKDWEIDRLVDGFCSLTRADLELDQNAKIEDSRQKAMKTFNHPDDFLISCIYAV